MKILFVCPNLPYPPDRGGSIRIYNIIKHLSRTNEIDLLGIDNAFIDNKGLSELKKYCNEVFCVEWIKKPFLVQLVNLILQFFRNEPFLLKYADSANFTAKLHSLTKDNNYDIIQFEHSYIANNIRHIAESAKSRTVITLHNVTFIQYFRMFNCENNISKKFIYLLNWFPMLFWEPRIAGEFDKTIVVSLNDCNIITALNPSLDVSVIPNGIDTTCNKPTSDRATSKNIIIVGSLDYEPNMDAIDYFYSDIFPLVRENIPDCTLSIVGKNPSNSIRSLADHPAVKVWGDVEDVREFYREALVSAVALRSGSGTRLKILEAMSLGIPVVSTSLGAEGLEIKDGVNILIANDPKEFASKICQLINDSSLSYRISKNARKLVEEKYDWETIARYYQDQYSQLLYRHQEVNGIEEVMTCI